MWGDTALPFANCPRATKAASRPLHIGVGASFVLKWLSPVPVTQKTLPMTSRAPPS